MDKTNNIDREYLQKMGSKIKQFRKMRGLTQDELAHAAGFKDRSSISQIESGISDISRDRFIKIADALSVDYSALLFDNNGNAHNIIIEAVSVPVLENITPVSSDASGAVDIPRKMAASGEHFAYIMRGDSMSPFIAVGDLLICKRQAAVKNGDIVVISVNGEIATVKRYQTERNLIMLYSDNPAFKPLMFTTSDNVNISIIGRVVEIRRQL